MQKIINFSMNLGKYFEYIYALLLLQLLKKKKE